MFYFYVFYNQSAISQVDSNVQAKHKNQCYYSIWNWVYYVTSWCVKIMRINNEKDMWAKSSNNMTQDLPLMMEEKSSYGSTSTQALRANRG